MFFVRFVVNGTTTVRHQRVRTVSPVDNDPTCFKIVFSVHGLNGVVECPLYLRVTNKTKRSQFDNLIKVAESAQDLMGFPNLFIRCDGTVPAVIVQQCSGPLSSGEKKQMSKVCFG